MPTSRRFQTGAGGIPLVETRGSPPADYSWAAWSAIIASSMTAITASAAAGNLLGLVTEAAGQRIKIAGGVSMAYTSSMLSWSAWVIWPEASQSYGGHGVSFPTQVGFLARPVFAALVGPLQLLILLRCPGTRWVPRRAIQGQLICRDRLSYWSRAGQAPAAARVVPTVRAALATAFWNPAVRIWPASRVSNPLGRNASTILVTSVAVVSVVRR